MGSSLAGDGAAGVDSLATGVLVPLAGSSAWAAGRGVDFGAGLSAGLDPDEDRRRFHVTPKGVTLISPQMLS